MFIHIHTRRQYLIYPIFCLCTWGIFIMGEAGFPHDGVIKRKHFPCYWPFVRGIHRSCEFPHKGQWRGAMMSFLICARINGWGWWFETPSDPLWRHCIMVLVDLTHILQDHFTEHGYSEVTLKDMGKFITKFREELIILPQQDKSQHNHMHIFREILCF